MRRRERGCSIECSTGLFGRQEAEAARLAEGINQAGTVGEKARLARRLVDAADALLRCEAYDAEAAGCRLCHQLSQVRRRTGALVAKAGQLEP